MRLAGKVALVTGGASGLGAEICRAFRNEGASVVIADIDQSRGPAVAESLQSRWCYLDVRDEESWSRTIDELLEVFGGVDVVVNNAGVITAGGAGRPQDPEHLSLEDWRAVHAINLDGTFLGCKYAIRAMRQSGGSIINMSSRAGLVGVPVAAAYASSKAAIRNHSKTVALYCAEQGLAIRCNSIHPGSVLTPIWDAALGEGADREARAKAFASGIPLGRFAAVEEISPIAVLLASDESGYITGAEFVVDGGTTAGTIARAGK